jgi:endonuclease/exonuclease/phosphatase family metal-dependent hydrolase
MLLTLLTYPQDTLTMMHYNLLYFGKNTDFCDQLLNEKCNHLKKIIQYTKPDIFAVNEFDGNASEPIKEDAAYLLDNVLNTDKVDHYRSTPFESTYLANTLFFNSNKLNLYDHHSIPLHVGNYEKIFNAYTFYYNSNDLSAGKDTIFLSFFVAHMKAGYGDSEREERVKEAEILMDFIKNRNNRTDNCILSGDLNVYSSNEAAFKLLTDSSTSAVSFSDPVDKEGSWHDNGDFSYFHTQSTHKEGGCFAGGGMDDRFDFILLSKQIMKGNKGFKYLSNSYQTLGQDGDCLNGSLNIEDNDMVSADIAKALYEFSDHLPLSLCITSNKIPAVELKLDTTFNIPANPVKGEEIQVKAQLTDTEDQVGTLKVGWGKQSGEYTHQTKMTLKGNHYSAKINGINETGQIFYRIKGYNSGNEVVLSSEEYSFSIEEGSSFISDKNSAQDMYVVYQKKNSICLDLKHNPEGRYCVQILDLAGKARFTKCYSRSHKGKIVIPASYLETGLYLVRVRTVRANYVEKFVKQ